MSDGRIIKERYDVYDALFAENEERKHQLKKIICDIILGSVDIDEFNDFILWAEQHKEK